MKKYFITGLIVLMPIVLTIFIFAFLVDILTNPFISFIKKNIVHTSFYYSFLDYEIIIRLILLIVLFLFVILLGVIGRLFIFKFFFNLANKLLFKIPIFRTIYKVIKEIVDSFVSIGEKQIFKKASLVNFPSEKSFCVSFETGQVPSECQKHISDELRTVFIPTSPHPISGYLVFVKRKNMKDLDITKEEALKLIVSCGLINPEDNK